MNMNKLVALAMTASISVGMTTMAPAAEPPRAPRVGYKVSDFTLNTPEGTPVTLSKLRAKSSVVLVVLRGYPGYQCPVCTLQVRGLLQNAQRFADANAQVVFIYPGPAEKLAQRAKEFLKSTTLPENFTLVIDPDYQFTNANALRWDAPMETAYPSTFVIDRQSTVRLAVISKTHGDRAKIEDVLNAVPGTKKTN
jgi:peroxiredoxin